MDRTRRHGGVCRRTRRRVALPAALLVAAGAAGGGGGGAVAQAQTFAQDRDTERGVTVTSRPRRDFDPLGVRLGTFRLDASASGGVGWDSNVFGRRRNVVSDGFLEEAARVALTSDWTRHAVGVSGTMNARQYFSRSDLDWADFDVGGFGRYDLTADTRAEAGYRHYRSHLDVYSFDVQRAGIVRPVQYDSDEFTASATTRLNRVGLLATGVYRTFRFGDTAGGGQPLQLSLNDFNTVIGAVGATYAIAPGRLATATVRVQDISYNNAASRARDSFTWEVLAGFQYDFDGVWQARFALGWRQREYQGPGIKPLSGPAFEATVTWAPTLLTTVRFAAASSIEESIRRDAVSFRRYTASVTVDHELLRNVLLNGQLRVDRREYESPTQRATDGLATVGATWLLNRNLALVGSYTYNTRLEATGGFSEFDRSLFLVRLRAAL